MNFKLTKIQFFLMLFFIETGVIYISFQQGVIDYGGRDAWIMFGVASIFMYLLLFFYEKNYKFFRLGKITKWIYILYWLVVIISFLSYMQYTLNVWIIQNMPPFYSLLAIVLVTLYISLSRPSTTVNLGVLIIPLVFIFIVFILLATHELKFSNILPIGTSTVPQWLKGMHYSLTAFIGIESYLMLRKNVLKDEEIKGKPILIFHLIVSIFMGASVIGVEFYFMLKEIRLIPDPILYILKSQKVTFVKRLDIFFIYIWLAWSLLTINLFLFNIRIALSTQEGKNPKPLLFIIHGIIMIAPLFFIGVGQVEFIRKYLIYLFYPFSIILPMIIILFNRRRDSKCDKSQ
ncbi:GerAB/ArcD/ProY family transporter [Rummeliibacillus sp. POC4]|uniref:GerAB/ArcD/ProY family transporter n=1 Tax=Rummeliibacillus sp. POC4 TaxID=2305899 RepID=UPI000E66C35B|nr:GerAB/ArcD/ProY family transporter [Rummeliibacillus sp. POC4]RIJ65483.1 spore gernimation protein [Rummeliibacillus sp. POC4]